MITVENTINASMEKVWDFWTQPEHITKWYFASNDWHAPAAENDLRVGGKFKTKMAAKDGSFGFDFEGEYTFVKEHEIIEYKLADGRKVKTTFLTSENVVTVSESFDPETENPIEIQKGGWQAILDNFKKHTEQH